MILQLAQELQPALQRLTKHHGALLVIVQVTNAFFWLLLFVCLFDICFSDGLAARKVLVAW